MNDQTQKRDAGKSDPLLIEVDLAGALALVNRVLDYGKEKYGTRAGWKAVDPQRYDSAMRRHRRSRDLGFQTDEESGLLHLAHEACNVLFLLQSVYDNANAFAAGVVPEQLFHYNAPPEPTPPPQTARKEVSIFHTLGPVEERMRAEQDADTARKEALRFAAIAEGI